MQYINENRLVCVSGGDVKEYYHGGIPTNDSSELLSLRGLTNFEKRHCGEIRMLYGVSQWKPCRVVPIDGEWVTTSEKVVEELKLASMARYQNTWPSRFFEIFGPAKFVTSSGLSLHVGGRDLTIRSDEKTLRSVRYLNRDGTYRWEMYTYPESAMHVTEFTRIHKITREQGTMNASCALGLVLDGTKVYFDGMHLPEACGIKWTLVEYDGPGNNGWAFVDLNGRMFVNTCWDNATKVYVVDPPKPLEWVEFFSLSLKSPAFEEIPEALLVE